mgnify:FL=1
MIDGYYNTGNLLVQEIGNGKKYIYLPDLAVSYIGKEDTDKDTHKDTSQDTQLDTEGGVQVEEVIKRALYQQPISWLNLLFYKPIVTIEMAGVA